MKDIRDDSSVVSKIVMVTYTSDLDKKKHFASVTPSMTVWDVSIKGRKWDHELDVGSKCQLYKPLLIMAGLKKGAGALTLIKDNRKPHNSHNSLTCVLRSKSIKHFPSAGRGRGHSCVSEHVCLLIGTDGE